jgi:hypothetical protein
LFGLAFSAGTLPITAAPLIWSRSWQPMPQNAQVVTSSRSPRPSHFLVFSASAPVGQTDTHAPQNSQPAARWVRANAGPMTVRLPRWVNASVPAARTSWHIRTHLPQRMHRL